MRYHRPGLGWTAAIPEQRGVDPSAPYRTFVGWPSPAECGPNASGYAPRQAALRPLLRLDRDRGLAAQGAAAVDEGHKDAVDARHVMWGSDYPHSESTFPQSRKILSEILAGVPDDEQAKIAGGNTARV